MTTAKLHLWINGQPVRAQSSRTGDVFDPASGEVIRRVPLAGKADVDLAVAAARAAFPGWRETTPLRRARILTRFRELMEQHRDELARLASEEHGKPLADAAGSVQRGIEVVEFASGVPHLAFFSFGGWKASLFGDLHMHGTEGVAFYTRSKVVTSRSPAPAERTGSTLAMPTLG